jgi:hypothetical protein
MPPSKRRTKGGVVVHQGRTTTRRTDTTSLPPRIEPSLDRPSQSPKAAAREPSARNMPATSSRYTPPVKSIRFRPGWHKAIGAGVLVLGLVVIVLNDLKLLGAPRTVLPGGHNELYFVLGLIIAGYSTWWFGWFDRTR